MISVFAVQHFQHIYGCRLLAAAPREGVFIAVHRRSRQVLWRRVLRFDIRMVRIYVGTIHLRSTASVILPLTKEHQRISLYNLITRGKIAVIQPFGAEAIQLIVCCTIIGYI